MRWEQPIQYTSISDIGFRRNNNQDAFVVQMCSDRESWEQHGHLFIIADGMGGHAVGELASKIAVDTIPLTYFKTTGPDVRSALKAAIEAANLAIYERGKQNVEFQRMGTTCVALALSPKGAVVGHVGDSRIYRIRINQIEQLTFDHSLRWELLRQKPLPSEKTKLLAARHVITRSLGPKSNVRVDVSGPYSVHSEDTFLLCSDGLTGHVSNSEIGVIAQELNPGDACHLLVNLAKVRGGSDNITVVIAKVGGLPAGAEFEPLPVEVPYRDAEIGWGWLASFWATAGVFILGVVQFLLRNLQNAAIWMSIALVAAVVLATRWLRLRNGVGTTNGGKGIPPCPTYTPATCKLTPEFLGQLAKVESELQRTASEEGWDINWARHEAAFASAQQFLVRKELSTALGEYAVAIDALMQGLQLHRNQQTLQSKWGKSNRSQA